VREEEVRKRGRLPPKRQKRRVGPAVYNAWPVRYRGDEQVRASPCVRPVRRTLTCDRARVYRRSASVRRAANLCENFSRGQPRGDLVSPAAPSEGILYRWGWISNGSSYGRPWIRVVGLQSVLFFLKGCCGSYHIRMFMRIQWRI
jgi:hypothetical protein